MKNYSAKLSKKEWETVFSAIELLGNVKKDLWTDDQKQKRKIIEEHRNLLDKILRQVNEEWLSNTAKNVLVWDNSCQMDMRNLDTVMYVELRNEVYQTHDIQRMAKIQHSCKTKY